LRIMSGINQWFQMMIMCFWTQMIMIQYTACSQKLAASIRMGGKQFF